MTATRPRHPWFIAACAVVVVTAGSAALAREADPPDTPSTVANGPVSIEHEATAAETPATTRDSSDLADSPTPDNASVDHDGAVPANTPTTWTPSRPSNLTLDVADADHTKATHTTGNVGPDDATAIEEITREESADSAAIEEPTEATGNVEAAAGAGVIASESAPLGTPNGLFSARPVEDLPDVETVGLIERLDPRTNGLVRVGLAMVVVVLLMLLLRRVFVKGSHVFAGASRPSGVVEVLARYPVGRGQTLMLIKLARRVLLVHQTNGSMETLTEVSEPREVAHLLARLEAGASGRAGERFKRMLNVYDTAYGDMPVDSETPQETGEVIDLTRRPKLRLLGGGDRSGRKSA